MYDKRFTLLAICFAALMLVIATLQSCTVPPLKEEEPPLVKVCGYGEWCVAWDKYFPYPDFDVSKVKIPFCSKGDKKELFRSWAQAIAYAESNYKSDEEYKESFIDSTTGENAISVGIYQLSKSDRVYYKQYKECATLDLKNGDSNAACAGRIMQHLLNQIPDIETLGRYWSTARSTNKRYYVTLNKFYELEPQCRK